MPINNKQPAAICMSATSDVNKKASPLALRNLATNNKQLSSVRIVGVVRQIHVRP